jgi:putative transposase
LPDIFASMQNTTHRKKLHRYNTSGHAHELTFSCYRRQPFFKDPIACRKFLEELEKSRTIYKFKLWAYVIMPHHVHLLIWPCRTEYDIGKIESGIKGIMAKKYRAYLAENNSLMLDSFIQLNGEGEFVFWQKGGGFDRNLWNSKAIFDSMKYIEANPVRSGLVESSEDWPWSSASTRKTRMGVVPDSFGLPVVMPNPLRQQIGKVY